MLLFSNILFRRWSKRLVVDLPCLRRVRLYVSAFLDLFDLFLVLLLVGRPLGPTVRFGPTRPPLPESRRKVPRLPGSPPDLSSLKRIRKLQFTANSFFYKNTR